jgi:tripartite-type tricarboxylate transporter receptor subunit TctC
MLCLRRVWFVLFALAGWGAALLLTNGPVVAGDGGFPSRPIRVLVPTAAGGPADIGARLAAEALGRVLNAPVYVENRSGRINVIESYLAAQADGYSILVGSTGTLTIFPVARQVPYDVEKDFVPLGTVWRTASALEVRTGLGVRTLAEFIAAAKAGPGVLTVGSAGVGTPAHLTIELLKREAGIDLIHVPFRNAGESLNAVIGGQVDALFGDLKLAAAQLKAGTVRALALTGPKRAPELPDVPTMAEAGLPGVASEPWFGFVVSAKTPPAITKRLQDALAATHDDPVYQKGLARLGVTPGERGPDALARLIRDDTARWRAVVTAAGIRLD